MVPNKIFAKITEYSFYCLFFITPFLVSINSFELFEFPKMLFVYLSTAVIAGSWLASGIIKGKITISRNCLLFPVFFFLISQIISTYLSVDRHTSFWGYYSRFHGGLVSSICYSLLFIVFTSSANRKQVKNCLTALISAAAFISLYGIAEHFGIDAKYWVQDVKNRVYSTLGQPNWLSAWLVALLPITWAMYLKPPKKTWPITLSLSQLSLFISYSITYFFTKKPLPLTFGPLLLFFLLFALLTFFVFSFSPKLVKIIPFSKEISLLTITAILTLAILYTRSRSGILALAASIVFFSILVLFKSKPTKTIIIKLFTVYCLLFTAILLVGTEWTPNIRQAASGKWQVDNFLKTSQKSPPQARPYPLNFISKSVDIRKAVWEGGLNVFKHYPLFGSGVETFAYSFYNYRPRSHNDTSEWDFLYNKAHNEYVNYLATTGIIGAIAILVFITSYFIFSLKKLVKKNPWTLPVFLSPLLLLLFPFFTEKFIIYPAVLKPLGLAFSAACAISLVFQFLAPCKLPKLTYLQAGLLAGFLSIIITNYFGFSVVCVALLFFLYPAFSSVLSEPGSETSRRTWKIHFSKDAVSWKKLNFGQWTGLIIVLLAGVYCLLFVFNYFLADNLYNRGKNLVEKSNVISGIDLLSKAIGLWPKEANYHMELSQASALVAFAYHNQNATGSAQISSQFIKLSQEEAQIALTLNPVHLNLYKSAAKIYLILGQIDSKYSQTAVKILETAFALSPNDPKIALNLGLLFEQAGNIKTAEDFYEKTAKLKPDYRPALLAKGKLYASQNKIDEAKKAYKYILENINPADKEAKELLKKLP